MRINFRQGIVSHQAGGFLQVNGTTGDVDILALNRPVTVTLAHKQTNYIHSEDNTVFSAWSGPFSLPNYWLYWDFDLLTFDRTFDFTTLEPVAQSAEPGNGNAPVSSVVAGAPGVGTFVVPEKYVLQPGRTFSVINSTGNDGLYVVLSATFDGFTGETAIVVNNTVPDSTPDGELTLDIDAFGIPLRTDGRIWFDTTTNTHYELTGNVWREVLRVFATQLRNGNVFIPQTITPGSFVGTQIGNTSSVRAGRVLFDEASAPIRRDDRTFFTTEDQFFTNQSRVDALRLESNVARAKLDEASAAQFQVVAWKGNGVVRLAEYDDVGVTVVGMLTEDLLLNEVGAVIIQGVVTNPDWTWTSGPNAVAVGSPLWVDNGELTPTDPHVLDAGIYPIGRVPVARVLDDDSVVFEQGLGGKGDVGPPGSIEDLPPATTTDLGGVTLVTPSSDSQAAFVISDTDPRLSDARTPLPHTHDAIDINVTPGFGISSNNAQGAFEELSTEKVDIAGDTMTGFLTLHANPVNTFHAATKGYVDALVSGLIWLNPICTLNMISDQVTTPPGSPVFGDSYIIPPGATGAWATFAAGNVVVWDGATWLDRGPLTGLQTEPRLGISFTSPTVASGSFIGRDNQIAIYDSSGVLQGFEVPVLNNAVFVCSNSDLYAFDQYAFNGSTWIQFGGATALTAGINLEQVGNALNVVDWVNGGTIDAKFWQGMEPSDLDSVYAQISHTQLASTVTFAAPYIGTDWGTVGTLNSDRLTSTNMQLVTEEMFDKKASKTPLYTDLVDLPSAANVHGMFAHVHNEAAAYFAHAGSWVQLAANDGTVQDHDHILPYDITLFIAGTAALLTDRLVGSYIATRSLTITGGATNLYGRAGTAPAANVTFDVQKNGVSVASITFLSGQQTPNSTTVDALDITLAAGDRFEIYSPSVAEATISDITLSIVACGTMGSCPT